MTLHKLPEGFIVTSDEKLEINDIVYSMDGIHEWFGLVLTTEPLPLKVIAQQDQIDFSALTEEEQKEIGYFNVEKLALKPAIEDSKIYTTSNTYDFRRGFEKGFQKAQELLSDRRFTLEDVQFAITQAFLSGMERIEEITDVQNQIIQSLSQPKSWQIEGEWVDDKFKITKIKNVC